MEFAYRVRNKNGELITGTLDAADKATAGSILRDQNYYIIEIKETTTPLRGLLFSNLWSRKVRARELSLFCRQLGTLIESGIPIIQSLRVTAMQANNPKLRDALLDLVGAIEEGYSLTTAFQRLPEVFPEVMCSMLEAGEISGRLDSVLERLAVQFEKEHAIREKTISAFLYPLVVLFVSFIAVSVLLAFVLPTFVGVFEQLSIELPVVTKVLLALSLYANQCWYMIIAILAILILVLRVYLHTPQGLIYRDQILISVPVFGDLLRKMIVARFCRTFASLVKSGVPILQALEVLQKTTGNQVMAAAVAETAEKVEQGSTIAEHLGRCKAFPPMVTQMIAVGEETGALDRLLEKLAFYYEQDVEESVSRLSATMEPVLILIVGGLVGAIIIAVLLPLFEIVGGVYEF